VNRFNSAKACAMEGWRDPKVEEWVPVKKPGKEN
jgi:hypothetical protein